MLKQSFCYFLVVNLVMSFGWFTPWVRGAEQAGSFSLSETAGTGMVGSEYVSGKAPGVVLMRINLWGGIRKPGIHHIPIGTNLVTLLSYAGGPENDAELDHVMVRKTNPDGTQTTQKYDVEEMINGNTTKVPVISVNDIVVVPQTQTVVSANTLTALSVISTLTSILIAGLLITKTTGSK